MPNTEDPAVEVLCTMALSSGHFRYLMLPSSHMPFTDFYQEFAVIEVQRRFTVETHTALTYLSIRLLRWR